jgi:hypothetical protein
MMGTQFTTDHIEAGDVLVAHLNDEGVHDWMSLNLLSPAIIPPRLKRKSYSTI